MNRYKIAIMCGAFATALLLEFAGFKIAIQYMDKTIDKHCVPKLDTIEQKIYQRTNDRYNKTDKKIQEIDKKIQELNKTIEKVNIQNEALKQMLSYNFPQKHKTSTPTRGGSCLSMRYMGKFRITAYCLDFKDCGKSKNNPEYGVTASMVHVKEWRTIAMDKSIPMGTVVYIPYFKQYPNHGIFVKEDHGGAIYGNRIDVYMGTNEQCDKFGVQNLDVYIISK